MKFIIALALVVSTTSAYGFDQIVARGRNGWPTQTQVVSHKEDAPKGMYCAGICGGCGMSSRWGYKNTGGCSCGRNAKGRLQHMYAFDANRKLHLSGYRKCPPGTHQPKDQCATTCVKNKPSSFCRPGFLPTNGIDSKENYCNHARHGVVCRKTDGSGHWHPPTGCTKKNTFPFAAQGNSPCRVGCPCPVFGFEPTTPFSKNVKNNENHCGSKRGMGVICRKTDGSGHWTQPNGCDRKGGFPYALDRKTGKNCQLYCPEQVKFEVAVNPVNFNAAKQNALKISMAKVLGVDAKFVKIVVGRISRRLIEAEAAAQLVVTVVVEVPESNIKAAIAKVQATPEAFQKATGAVFVAYQDASILKQATCAHTTCTYSPGQTTVFTKTSYNEKWHCEKSGSGCKCVCHKDFKCAMRHVTLGGYRRTVNNC